jgi:tetratricopeptide (TPR) repeat protein
MDEQNAGPLFAAAYEQYSPTAGATPDFARALDLFRNLHIKYPSSLSGEIAQLYAGNCLMNLGRTEEALKEYQGFTGEYKNDNFLLGLAYQRMGYLYSALGNQPEAIKAFERADSLSGPGAATVELARLYEASGNSQESQKKYKTIADKLAGTAWAMEAMGKVQKIESPPGPSPIKDAGKQDPGKKSN